MPNALAATTTTRFATVTNLLVICDLAVHRVTPSEKNTCKPTERGRAPVPRLRLHPRAKKAGLSEPLLSLYQLMSMHRKTSLLLPIKRFVLGFSYQSFLSTTLCQERSGASMKTHRDMEQKIWTTIDSLHDRRAFAYPTDHAPRAFALSLQDQV